MLTQDDLSPTDTELLRLLQIGRITAPYAAEKLEYSKQHVRDRLRRLVEHGHVEKVHEGLYELRSDPRPPNIQHEESKDNLEKSLKTCKSLLQDEQLDRQGLDNLITVALDEVATFKETRERDTESNQVEGGQSS